MGIGPFWLTNIAISLVLASIAGIILYVYLSNFMRVKSRFSIGLITFISAVVVKNFLAAYAYFNFALWGLPAFVALPMLFVGVLELIGFITLLIITLKP